MRPAAALFLLSCAALAAPHAGAALHKDAGLARSGCVVVLETLQEMLAYPPEELRTRTVPDASGRPLQYTATREFFELSVRMLCSSGLLAQYRPEAGLLGDKRWVARRRSAPTRSAVPLRPLLTCMPP